MESTAIAQETLDYGSAVKQAVRAAELVGQRVVVLRENGGDRTVSLVEADDRRAAKVVRFDVQAQMIERAESYSSPTVLVSAPPLATNVSAGPVPPGKRTTSPVARLPT